MSATAIGGVALGDRESRVRRLLGAPNLVRRGFLRWCLQPGGSLRVGNDPTIALITTSPAYSLHGVHPGSSLGALRRAFTGERPTFTAANARVWLVSPRGGLAAGVRSGRVTYLALYDRAKLRTRAALRTLLQRGG
jgi:hypothetical protein